MHWGHWVPQYDFVYDTATIPNRRIVHHLLFNEHLNEQFPKLVKAYNLSHVTLPQAKKLDRNKTGAKWTSSDLSYTTMKLIEFVFADDFKLGGYDMLSGVVLQRDGYRT